MTSPKPPLWPFLFGLIPMALWAALPPTGEAALAVYFSLVPTLALIGFLQNNALLRAQRKASQEGYEKALREDTDGLPSARGRPA